MTPKAEPRSTIQAEEAYESFQLVDRTTDALGSEHDFGDHIYPDTDESLLREHRLEDRDSSADENKNPNSGLLHRIVALMSGTPLLGGSNAAEGSTSYGALPSRVTESSPEVFQSNDLEGANNDVRKGDKRKGKSTAIPPTASSAGFGSRRCRDESASHSRNRSRTASLLSSGPKFVVEPGHSAGQGGHVGDGSPLATGQSEDEDDEEAISIDDDEALGPPDNSPYPPVRASVAANDDISASINTPRMWILSLLCAFLGSATNLFFSLRYPSVAITPVIALVVVHIISASRQAEVRIVKLALEYGLVHGVTWSVDCATKEIWRLGILGRYLDFLQEENVGPLPAM